MTISQNSLDRIYTSKDGKLTNYSLKGLHIGKPALARFNKLSDNGISITLCDSISTKYESKVSKSGAEKGIKPVIIEAGGTILFEINSQSTKDGKPSEDAPLISTFGNLLKSSEVREGEIFFLSCDLDVIPTKGFDEKYLAYLKSQGESIPGFAVDRFDSSEDFAQVCDHLGFAFEEWKERLEKLSGEIWTERAGYAPRKSYGEILKERVDFFATVDPILKAQILELTVSTFDEEVEDEEGNVSVTTLETVMDWGNFVRDTLINI